MSSAGHPMTALVVEANRPIDNRVKWGSHSLGLIRILIDSTPDPIYVAGRFKLDRDCWPVRGMELPVTIDPADPSGFTVRWEEVPSIEDRVAANDLTLADPLGTREKTMKALAASGATSVETAEAAITSHMKRSPTEALTCNLQGASTGSFARAPMPSANTVWRRTSARPRPSMAQPTRSGAQSRRRRGSPPQPGRLGRSS